MTPEIILHIAHSDYARNIRETGDNEGFTADFGNVREFTALMRKMGWKRGLGWCNYYVNSVWWRALMPSFPDALQPVLERALNELLNEKDSLQQWNVKPHLAPLWWLGMRAITPDMYHECTDEDIRAFMRSAFRGSLVIFSCDDEDDNERGKEDHIGLGLHLDEAGVVCMEGNAGDALITPFRSWSSEKILGWIMPPQKYPEWNNYELPTM
ncbi:MAG: hypothetical protein ACOVSW_16820 [Candidatus Kapaibacteriota bacterium]